MRIVISGPPSIGKSTQARLLARWLVVPHISSGELIRKGAEAGGVVETRLLGIVADGSLAPSGEIVQLVLNRIAMPDCSGGFVLDGFPRTPFEGDILCSRLNGRLDAFVRLQAPADVLIDRVQARASQGSFMRADDDPAYFPRRLATYERETMQVGSVMARWRVRCLQIGADRPVAAIQEDIRDVLPLDLGLTPEVVEEPAFAF